MCIALNILWNSWYPNDWDCVETRKSGIEGRSKWNAGVETTGPLKAPGQECPSAYSFPNSFGDGTGGGCISVYMSLECVINLLLKQSHQLFDRQDATQIWQVRCEKQLQLLSIEVCYLRICCLHVTHHWLVQIPQMLCTSLSMLLAKVTEVHTNLSTQQWAPSCNEAEVPLVKACFITV